MNKNRLIFNAGTEDLGLQVVETVDGHLSFSANNDWCGCSETGFGAEVTVKITKEDAIRLVELLNKFINA